MDLALRERLNLAARHSGYDRDSQELMPSRVGFDGGSWTEYVVQDGRCYHVKRADPLHPMDYDVWYRVSCK